MGGQKDLTAKEPGGILQELGQLPLALDGQAVLRLVQEVEGILPDPVGEVPEGGLPVGLPPEVFPDTLLYIGGAAGAATRKESG